MKRLRYLLLVALAVYLLTGVAQIRPEERAVVRRFGKVVAHPAPGLWVGFPYGIDRLDRVPTATVRRVPVGYRPELVEDTPTGQFLTGDQNLVNVQVAIDYAVGEGPTDLEDYVAQKDRVDGGAGPRGGGRPRRVGVRPAGGRRAADRQRGPARLAGARGCRSGSPASGSGCGCSRRAWPTWPRRTRSGGRSRR